MTDASLVALGRVSSGEIVFVVLAAAWLVFDVLRQRRRRTTRAREQPSRPPPDGG